MHWILGGHVVRIPVALRFCNEALLSIPQLRHGYDYKIGDENITNHLVFPWNRKIDENFTIKRLVNQSDWNMQ